MKNLLNLKRDDIKINLLPGFVVFMLALPLSIGISVASGAPPTAGIITAIIGGIIGSFVTGSYVTINGPAAGLIVIVFACIDELGAGDAMAGYRAMLACTVGAGVIQMVLGRLRAGKLGLAFPSNVVHAMLSAIGIIIISKQIYVMFGLTPQGSGPISLYLNFPAQVLNMNFAIALIGASSLYVVMKLGQNRHIPLIQKIPAPLVAVVGGIFLGHIFNLEVEHKVASSFGLLSVGPNFLLNIPSHISDAFFLPDFSKFWTFTSLKHTLMITFVASTESILSACAIDRLDPAKRKSDLDRELLGKGLCNTLAGLIGGLPMIAEIVRSSANIENGGKTQASNFFHGVFLLLFLTLAPKYLHLIPLASLAGVLVATGYQLAKPHHFFHAIEKGRDAGIVFAVTVVAILATDLLIGVLIGTAVELSLVALRGRTLWLFSFKAVIRDTSKGRTVKVLSPLAFSNYLQLRETIVRSNDKGKLTIDLRRARVVDQTVMEHLQSHGADLKENGTDFDLLFSENHQSQSAHPSSTRILHSMRERVTQ